MGHLYVRRKAGDNDLRIILTDLRPGEDEDDVAERLYYENSTHLLHSDALVIRTPPWLTTELSSRPFRQRAPKAALYALRYERETITCSSNLNPKVPDRLADADLSRNIIEILRQEELVSFIRTSSALFGPTDGVLYRSPSGKLCRAFLRAGSVQKGRHEIDALSFWLMPHVNGVGAVIADTWSIASVTLNTIRWASLILQAPLLRPMDFEVLPGYQDGSAASASEAIPLLRTVSNSGRRQVLMLISTVMTGASLDRVRRLIGEIGLETTFRFVGLYGLGKNIGAPILCDVSSGVLGTDFGVVDETLAHDEIIEVDSRTYFPMRIKDRPVNIRKAPVKDEISAIHKFFNAYQGIGAVALHRDAREETNTRLRHHAFYVDVAKMLESRTFLGRLQERLDELKVAPRLILVPPHKAGLSLARIVQTRLEERFGVRAECERTRSLDDQQSQRLVERLRTYSEDDEVVVIDDVSVTGARLGEFQRPFRGCFQGRVNYLIGVARPESTAAWKKRIRELRSRDGHGDSQHRVLEVEALVLPDWDRDQCPWCQEEKLLDRLRKNVNAGRLKALLNTRLRQLALGREGSGLVEDAIWRLPEAGSPKLTPGSIFMALREDSPANDADVTVAVAAVLQSFRKIPTGLHSQYPLFASIDIADYLGTTCFTDAVLRIAFLRAAKRAELVRRTTDGEQSRRAAVRQLLLGGGVKPQDRVSLVLEFAMGILSGKLPEPRLEPDEWTSVASEAEDVLRLTEQYVLHS